MFAALNADILLAANKTDLENQRQVDVVETIMFAERHHLELIETSALSGENISAAFKRLALGLLMRPKDERNQISQVSPKQSPQGCR
jgi:signal recognition particle receptor subunit beta